MSFDRGAGDNGSRVDTLTFLLLVASLLLVAMPLLLVASVLLVVRMLLVAMPGAPSSFLLLVSTQKNGLQPSDGQRAMDSNTESRHFFDSSFQMIL